MHLKFAHILFSLSLFLLPLSTHAAVNASQTLVLQTGGTERARLDATTLTTTTASSPDISTTLLKLSQTTPPACNGTTKGYMLYTASSTAPLQLCDGTTWRRITLQ